MNVAARLAIVIGVVVAPRAHAQRDASWELEIPERIELVAKAGGTLPITIAVDRGKTISRDAALVLDLAPEGGVSVKRKRLGRADAVDPDADSPRFAIALRADTPGDFSVKVRLRFWLCGGKVCKPIEARRSIAIAVAALAPTPAP